MKETKSQLKERLQAIGQWSNFVAQREQLKKEGWSPADAHDEALRRIESLPPQASKQSIENQPSNPSPVEDPGQTATAIPNGLDFSRVVPNHAAVEWVAQNLANDKTQLQDAPSGVAWALLVWVRIAPANQSTFWSSIWPKLLPTSAALKRNQEVDAGEDWDGMEPCPTCGREAEPVDEGSQRVRDLLGETWAEVKEMLDARRKAAKAGCSVEEWYATRYRAERGGNDSQRPPNQLDGCPGARGGGEWPG
jgi:hypothetical protein